MDRSRIKRIFYNKNVILIIFIALFLLTILLDDSSLKNPDLEPITEIELRYSKVNPQKLINHSLIKIKGNNNFHQKALTEGWQGNGTQINPYVIENYRIKGIIGWDSSVGESLIDLKNIDVYFVIKNCILYNGWYGIFFENVRNGYVVNSLAFNNSIGIFVKNSYSNLFNNNTVYKNRGVGFNLQTSEKNSLTNNSASFNGREGFAKPCNLYENIYEDNFDLNNDLNPNKYPLFVYIFLFLLILGVIYLILYLAYLIIKPNKREELVDFLLLIRNEFLKHIFTYIFIFGLLVITIFVLNSEQVSEFLKKLICR